MKKLIILCLPFLLLSCKQIAPTQTAENTFAIYTLKDSTMYTSLALQHPIDSLVLDDTPFLTSSYLKSYTWSTHTFELTSEMNSKWGQMQKLRGKSSGVPFIVTVGKEKIYIGTFWWAYSSMMPSGCAVIQVISIYPYKIDLSIGATDKRSDPRIYNSLKEAGVLLE